jgi:hypothetical protein
MSMSLSFPGEGSRALAWMIRSAPGSNQSSEDLLQVVGHVQTSLPFSSRSAAMVS